MSNAMQTLTRNYLLQSFKILDKLHPAALVHPVDEIFYRKEVLTHITDIVTHARYGGRPPERRGQAAWRAVLYHS